MQESLYKELFPQSKLEKEKASNKRWRTAAGGEMYAVSTQGQVTGFGAGNVDEEEPKNILFMIDTSSSMRDHQIATLKKQVKKACIQYKDSMKGWLGFFDDKVTPPKAFSDYGLYLSGESFKTVGYGFTEIHNKSVFDLHKPFPCSEQLA